MFAQRVDLADRGAGLEKLTRHGLLLGERHARRGCDQRGRRSARYQHKNEVVLGCALGECEHSLRCREAGRIRHRVSGFDERNPTGRAAIAVAGHRDAVEARRRQRERIDIMTFRHLGHRARGLACGQHEQLPHRRRRQEAREARGRVNRRDRGIEQVFEKHAG